MKSEGLTIELLSPFTDAGYTHERCPHESIFADNCVTCLRRMYSKLHYAHGVLDLANSQLGRLHNEMKAERDAAVNEACSAGAALAEAHKALADEKASADRARAERNEMRIQLGEEAGLRLQAQAREQALRGAGVKLKELGEYVKQLHYFNPEWSAELKALDVVLARPADDSALREFEAKVREDERTKTPTHVLNNLARAAAIHPVDDPGDVRWEALREFGLKVGYRVARRSELRDARDTVEAAVDAVIRGER